MGAGIAAHCANAGCEVLLLDIVPFDLEEGGDRNGFARGAIERMSKSNPEMLMHPDFSARITAGNLEDDLPLLADGYRTTLGQAGRPEIWHFSRLTCRGDWATNPPAMAKVVATIVMGLVVLALGRGRVCCG